MGNLIQLVRASPFPEFHHPLLMAGRTERTALAGKSQKISKPWCRLPQSRRRSMTFWR